MPENTAAFCAIRKSAWKPSATRTASSAKNFGTEMFPETYIIQDGRIIRKVVGAIDWMSADMISFMRARLARYK
jgi:hypothetical protein